jgi:two-component system LytT family sensor kinase
VTVIPSIKKWFSPEALIHLFLWILYFVVIAYAKDYPHLYFHEFIFTGNYFIAIIIINYWLLPRFLYRQRYAVFILGSLFILAVSIFVEEGILEPLFFPGTRMARSFPGIVFHLSEIGPTFLFFIGFKFAWDNLKKESRLKQLEKEKAESELQLLKLQLNPHFLFNNLNNLFAYAQESSPKTPEIILQLSSIMRYMLYESREKFVPLEKELNYLKDFIRLQELQLENRGRVEFSVTGTTEGKRIAPLLLIPFVENSFKHSLSSQSDNILISIDVEIQGRRLIFNCANTYAETGNHSGRYVSKGIGLANVRKRLNLLYPGKYQLGIEAADGIYHVKLQLDL